MPQPKHDTAEDHEIYIYFLFSNINRVPVLKFLPDQNLSIYNKPTKNEAGLLLFRSIADHT